jgi:hypothetical protein
VLGGGGEGGACAHPLHCCHRVDWHVNHADLTRTGAACVLAPSVARAPSHLSRSSQCVALASPTLSTTLSPAVLSACRAASAAALLARRAPVRSPSFVSSESPFNQVSAPVLA